MNISDSLRKEAILLDLQARRKEALIDEMAEILSRDASLPREDLARVLMDRERLGSTGIGNGIGIPHGKLDGLDSLVMAVGISRRGVEFDAIDGKPTHIFFVLVAPEGAIESHLRMLARVSQLLKSETMRSRLMNAGSREDVIRLIRQEEEAL